VRITSTHRIPRANHTHRITPTKEKIKIGDEIESRDLVKQSPENLLDYPYLTISQS
jgi:hypothetical protein